MTILNNKQFYNAINNAKNAKAKYREYIQEALVYFVNQYNENLDYNTTPLKQIISICGKEAGFVRVWLGKYTTMKSISNDLLHFTTSEKIEVEGKTKYLLKFNESFEGQKWFESEKESDGVQAFSDKQALSLIKSLIKKMTSDDNTISLDTKPLVKTLTEYQTKFEIALGN